MSNYPRLPIVLLILSTVLVYAVLVGGLEKEAVTVQPTATTGLCEALLEKRDREIVDLQAKLQEAETKLKELREAPTPVVPLPTPKPKNLKPHKPPVACLRPMVTK